MKRTVALISALLCLVIFASCGGAPVVVIAPGTTEAGSDTADIFAFEYNGVVFHVGDLMDAKGNNSNTVRSKIGEPVEYNESNSCAYQGLNKVYTYNGFTVYSYPDGDNDYVQQIVVSDDSVSTPAGIRIGSSVAELAAAYGDENVSEDKTYSFDSPDGRTMISFKVSDGVIKYIQYSFREN